MVPTKGVQDEWAYKSLAAKIALSGHRRIVVRSDGEPAMVAYKRELAKVLARKFGTEVVPEQ
eukprot:12407831-Prorocentrum_lima.AAC.1